MANRIIYKAWTISTVAAIWGCDLRREPGKSSAASCNVDLVIGPGPDDRAESEIALWLGTCVVSPHVSGDRVALPGVGAMVGAIEREVPQCNEFGFGPVQPGGVGRQEIKARSAPHTPYGASAPYELRGVAGEESRGRPAAHTRRRDAPSHVPRCRGGRSA